MQTYEILVRDRSVASGSEDTTLVRTSVGIDQIHVLFDNHEWLEFPVVVTFGRDDVVVTESLVLNELEGSDGWLAEGIALIPWEVIQTTGPMRITLQGTDSEGRHIITAKGSPLTVIESGDVDEGDVPQDAPSTDQWTQAYASALEVTNQASTIVRNLQAQIDTLVSSAEARIAELVDSLSVPATTESLGVVQIGDGLDITNDGLLSAINSGLTEAQERRLTNIGALVSRITDANIDDSTTFESCAISSDTLPYATITSAGAVKVDGTTITIDRTGVIHGGVDVRYSYVGNSSYLRKALVVGSDSDGIYDFIDMRVVPSSAFMSCSNLKSVSLGRCVDIGSRAFFQCQHLERFALDVCTNVGYDAFYGCASLQYAHLPKCETIQGYAFGGCTNMSYVSIPACRQIGSSAFTRCSSIVSLSLPSIESIGRGAFRSCASLQTINMRGIKSVPYLNRTQDEVFDGTKIGFNTGSIIVPASLYESFVNDSRWSAYSRVIKT